MRGKKVEAKVKRKKRKVREIRWKGEKKKVNIFDLNSPP